MRYYKIINSTNDYEQFKALFLIKCHDIYYNTHNPCKHPASQKCREAIINVSIRVFLKPSLNQPLNKTFLHSDVWSEK